MQEQLNKSDYVASAALENTLLERGAAVIEHSRSSLFQHLLGTSAILRNWNQPLIVQLAGLFHSVYSTDRFNSNLFSLQERALVRDVIGLEAERLVFLFCTTNRDDLLNTIKSKNPEGFLLSNRQDRSRHQISDQELQWLLVMHLANLAEQSCTMTGAPAEWLVRASHISSLIQSMSDDKLPRSLGMERVYTSSEETELGDAYIASLLAGCEEGARSRLRSAAENLPAVAEPWIWLGLLSLAEGETGAAIAYGKQALRRLRGWGVAWDKRLAETHWLRLAMLLSQSGTTLETSGRFLSNLIANIIFTTSARPEGIFTRLDGLVAFEGIDEDPIETSVGDGPTQNLPPLIPTRFQVYLNGLRSDEEQPRLNRYPGLVGKPWWENARFPIVADLERHATVITEEFNRIDPSAFHAESESVIRRQGEWNVFMLFERGKKQDDNCRIAPVTTSIIEAHATMRTHSGLAYFSRMAPGTTILPHSGPTNMRLRCHLGIEVPESCGISVAGVAQSWQRGKCLIFDDSFVHEAWNMSTHERIVLIIDLWHPDLNSDEIALISGIHRHIDAVANGLKRYWRINENAPRMKISDAPA